ncbi:MAG: hypothetical protein FJY97_07270 [candidate division Zixibacteria bacterium]|nr:hypothetical protein [candidate division Zixibacteria bacterium]
MKRCIAGCCLIFFVATIVPTPLMAQTLDIRGAWKPETYRMKDGTVHIVTGLITFTEKDWSVLFFIITAEGPQRASGEGGTYGLTGDRLTFRHLYHFAGEKGDPTKLIMTARDPKTSDAPDEPCTIEIQSDLLTIHFPSGNRMTFRRSSGF